MNKNFEKEELSRKDREKLFKRNEILNAAKKLFAVKGYSFTTMEEIASAAEFGKGTIYNYFTDKESIYHELINEILKDYFEILKSADKNSTGFENFLGNLTSAVFHYSFENQHAFLILVKERLRIISSEKFNSEKLNDCNFDINEIFKKRINKAIKEKEIKKISVESLIILYRSFLFPYLYQLLIMNEQKKINIQEELNSVLSILFNGVLTNKKVD